MINLGNLSYTLGANTTGLDAAERRVNRFAETHNKRMGEMGKAARTFGIALGGYIGIETIKNTVMIADKYAVLEQRIKTATESTGDWVAVQKEVIRISKENGTSLATNVSLYQGLARSATELGATNKDMLQFTDLLGKLGSIGGSSQTAMDAGLLQLSQGLAGGILRAEELNSIFENIPEVGVRIAQGLGMTTGELRAAVLEGKVLSQDVFQSLMQQAPGIAAEFEKMPLSIGRSWSMAETAFATFIGQVDRAFGGTESIAQSIKRGADLLSQDWGNALDNIAFKFAQIEQGFANWKALIGQTASEITGSLNPSLDGTKSIAQGVIDAFKNLPFDIRTGIVLAQTGFETFFLTCISSIDLLGDDFAILWANVQNAGMQAAAKIQKSFASLVSSVMPGVSSALTAASDAQLSASDAQLKALKDEMDFKKDIFKKDVANIETIGKERLAALEAEKSRAVTFTPNSQPVNTGISNATPSAIAPIKASTHQAFGAPSTPQAGGSFSSATPTDEVGIFRDKYAQIEAETQAHYDNMSTMQKLGAAIGLKTQQEYDSEGLAAKEYAFRTQLGMVAGLSKQTFAASKALNIALALIDAPKAIASAFNFGLSISGGNPAVGFAMGAVAGAAVTAQINQIRGAQFQGSKAFGGEVMAGGTYRVNEQGPELLSVGGEDFLMMGSKGGKVTPNNELGNNGGGGAVTVNVHNAPQNTKVQQRQTPGGTTIDIIIEAVENAIAQGISKGGSLLSASLENQYGLNRAGGLNY